MIRRRFVTGDKKYGYIRIVKTMSSVRIARKICTIDLQTVDNLCLYRCCLEINRNRLFEIPTDLARLGYYLCPSMKNGRRENKIHLNVGLNVEISTYFAELDPSYYLEWNNKLKQRWTKWKTTLENKIGIKRKITYFSFLEFLLRLRKDRISLLGLSVMCPTESPEQFGRFKANAVVDFYTT